MKKILFLLLALCFKLSASFAQEVIKDQAIENQSQRMVFQQWNQNDFYPKAGFLDLNPYYWLVWGLFDPNYHKTDLRPLSATGPQTQRLALVAGLNSTDNKYNINSDTVRNTALSQIANQSGFLSDADPLWVLYYNQQFQPLLNYSALSILGPLPPQVSAKLVSEGMYSWYTNALDRLKQRLNGARTTDMDRGSRIMASKSIKTWPAFGRYGCPQRKRRSIWRHRRKPCRIHPHRSATGRPIPMYRSPIKFYPTLNIKL